MKKLFKFLNRIFGAIKGPAIEKGGDFMEEALEAYAAKKPVQASALVSSLYVWVDTDLEDLAKRSGADVPESIVAEIKQELEEFATRHNLTLQNLDAGTPND